MYTKVFGATSLSKALAKQQGVCAYLTQYILYQGCEEAVKYTVFRFFGCEVHLKVGTKHQPCYNAFKLNHNYKGMQR